MKNTIDIIVHAYTGYWNYLVHEITHPSWTNYLYWLVGLSLAVWFLEIVVPWRKNQGKIRKDFWIDVWYMFFNFFIFSLVIYNAASDVVVEFVRPYVPAGFIDVRTAPAWLQLLIMFVVRDFLQWNIHRLLHRVPFLWKVHQVHHSVEEMGFAAHLRFHWGETIVYRTLEYLPLAAFGFGLDSFFLVHIISLAIGHLNHANIYLPIGPLRYIFNTPQMHIWHHAETQPKNSYGTNYGLSLSLWDYLFGTAWIPGDGRDVKLGFDTIASYPRSFWRQLIAPWRRG